MSTLLPLYDRVIVRRVMKDKMVGSIEVVRRREEEPGQGEVVAVGPKVASVLPGERVLFAEGEAKTLHFMGEELLAVHDEDLMAVISQ